MRYLAPLLLLACGAAQAQVPAHGWETAVRDIVSASTLNYVSDYLSFTGADAGGRVAFALDTNRGRDGDDFQAEHFVVMHAEGEGWMDLAGGGEYDNAGGALVRIPDSPAFRFSGTPATGLVLDSPANELRLVIEPIPERLVLREDKRLFAMGSAAATLKWRGRTLEGRVIYELLAMADFNRLSRFTWGSSSGSFQGLYLRVDGADDFYVHLRENADGTELIAFGARNGTTYLPEDIDFEVTDYAFAPGFYRWPVAWTVRWETGAGPASLTLRLNERKLISTWGFGGFAMGIVEGTLQQGGDSRDVYGLGELIR